eukprot:gnl/TRDRNA2_/TRDRNA2_28626_c0_seq1.p1 gnl/TRDRNA2_/TRDRNA2_28626_c0~~gnl/TRDRNA2_/TRDRNA2_28626_c0_seq1.p1  ORF type:complete len:200 (+),score=37.12 gnl/TRDRNA2_/TRDRNA2_28626_c0_seq1:59-601(+)
MAADVVDQEQFEKMLKTFQKFDTNGDGTISEVELTTVLLALGVEKAIVHDTFLAADVNCDGTVSYQEFLAWVTGGSMAALAAKEGKHVRETQVLQLLKRFPGFTTAEVAEVLEICEGHGGKTAKILSKWAKVSSADRGDWIKQEREEVPLAKERERQRAEAGKKFCEEQAALQRARQEEV